MRPSVVEIGIFHFYFSHCDLRDIHIMKKELDIGNSFMQRQHSRSSSKMLYEPNYLIQVVHVRTYLKTFPN